MKRRRADFLALALLMAAIAGLEALDHDYPWAGLFAALALGMAVVHWLRLRRFK